MKLGKQFSYARLLNKRFRIEVDFKKCACYCYEEVKNNQKCAYYCFE